MADKTKGLLDIANGLKGSAGSKMLDYSLFLGGLNAKNSSLEAYTPYKTGYSRIFFVRMPAFLKHIAGTRTRVFRHLLEYGFIGIDGIQNTTLEMEQMTGGYAGRQLDIATGAKNETNEITIRAYEFTGSPLRTYLDAWVSGISDPHTGYAHYHGADIKFKQSNHTAEAIYLTTDATGRAVEYACFLANMMPKQVKKDHLNYEAGTHNVVTMDMPFTAVHYESLNINRIAVALLDKYSVLGNGYNFNAGLDEDIYNTGKSMDDRLNDAQKPTITDAVGEADDEKSFKPAIGS